MLLRKGRIRLPQDLKTWVSTTMSDMELVEAPLTIEIALAVSSFTFSHGDPADQFIAATAKVFDLTLATADEQLLRLPGIDLLANR